MTVVEPWLTPTDADPAAWRAWANGLPLCRDLGMVCLSLDEVHGTFVVAETPLAPNPNGSTNGGMVTAIADLAMGVMATRGARHGHYPATASLHSQFHAPAHAPLHVTATVLGGGRRVRFVEVVIGSEDGTRYVTSHGTMVVSDPNRSFVGAEDEHH